MKDGELRHLRVVEVKTGVFCVDGFLASDTVHNIDLDLDETGRRLCLIYSDKNDKTTTNLSIPLPGHVDEDDIKCTFSNKALTITVPEPSTSCTSERDGEEEDSSATMAAYLADKEEQWAAQQGTEESSSTSSSLNGDPTWVAGVASGEAGGIKGGGIKFTTPPVLMDDRLAVVPVKGKGIGVVATTGIPQGSVLYLERAIAGGDMRSGETSTAAILRILRGSPMAIQALLDEIEPMAPSPGQMRTHQEQLSAARKKAGIPDTEAACRIHAVFSCNAYQGGLFPYIAQVNHSCAPNCTASFGGTGESSGCLEVCARRAIGAGEELTIRYRSIEPSI